MMWGFVVLVCVIAGVWMLWEQTKRRAIEAVVDMAGVSEEDAVTKHRQIELLEQAGVRFRDPGEKHRFLLECTTEESEYYYSHPYDALLAAAGEAGLLDVVWSCQDRECVYEEDTYGKVLEGLCSISRLPVTDIRGYDTYSVSFVLGGRTHTWRAKDNRDWLDTRLAGYLNRLLDKDRVDTGRFYLDDSHLSPLYLFGPLELAQRLNQLPRLQFRLAK